MSSMLPEPSIRWLFMSWKGRIGRQSYILGAALLLVVQIYILLEIGFAGEGNAGSDVMAAWGFVMIGYWIASIIGLLALNVKRMHDAEFPTYWVVCLVIPGIGTLFSIYLMFVPGTGKTNQYGPSPFAKDR
jgi:uncharacterized membrane protein YhaH (DUF805 family)